MAEPKKIAIVGSVENEELRPLSGLGRFRLENAAFAQIEAEASERHKSLIEKGERYYTRPSIGLFANGESVEVVLGDRIRVKRDFTIIATVRNIVSLFGHSFFELEVSTGEKFLCIVGRFIDKIDATNRYPRDLAEEYAFTPEEVDREGGFEQIHNTIFTRLETARLVEEALYGYRLKHTNTHFVTKSVHPSLPFSVRVYSRLEIVDLEDGLLTPSGHFQKYADLRRGCGTDGI